MNTRTLEKVVAEIFRGIQKDVVRVTELEEKKAEAYKKYFSSRGYRVIMGAIVSNLSNELVYEIDIWRKR